MNLARRKPEQPLSARHGKQYAIESWPDLPTASPRAWCLYFCFWYFLIRLSLVIQFVLLVVVLEDSVTANGSWFRAHFYKRPPQPRRGQDLLNTPTHHFFETEMCHVWKLQGDLFKWQTDAHAGHVCNGGVIPSIPRPAWLLFNVAQVTSGTSQTMWGGPHMPHHGRIFAKLVTVVQLNYFASSDPHRAPPWQIVLS